MKEFEGCFKSTAVWMELDSQKESLSGFLSGCTISTVGQPVSSAFSGVTTPLCCMFIRTLGKFRVFDLNKV